MTVKKYFENFPKYDLFSHSPIPFKSYEQYAQADFLNKKNLKSWLSELEVVERIEYLRGKFNQYLFFKNVKYVPCYIESCLVSSLISIEDIENLCEIGFDDFCVQANLNSKFSYRDFELKFNYISDSDLIIDTREQKPFSFPELNAKNIKLEYGDYALEKNLKIAIERKCYSDFISTFSSDIPRFERELERAKKDDGYVVVVCESTLNNILYSKHRRYGKASPHFISHNLRKLMREHDNLQFVFCSSREEAKNRSFKILQLGDQIRNLDLQYYFNYGVNRR
jgi:hypothetical protein